MNRMQQACIQMCINFRRDANIYHDNSTCWEASILGRMLQFHHQRYPLYPGERNCQTQSLSSLGVVWRCGATVSQPSGTGIRNNKLDGCFFSRHNSLADTYMDSGEVYFTDDSDDMVLYPDLDWVLVFIDILLILDSTPGNCIFNFKCSI